MMCNFARGSSESTLSRRDFLRLSSATALTTTLAGCVGYPPIAESNPDLAPPPQVSDTSSTGGYDGSEKPVNLPQEALQRLMEGNQRFVANRLNESQPYS